MVFAVINLTALNISVHSLFLPVKIKWFPRREIAGRKDE